MVVITHPHTDHYDLLPDVLEDFKPAKKKVVPDDPLQIVDAGSILLIGSETEYKGERFKEWMEKHEDKLEWITADHCNAADEVCPLFGEGDTTFQILAAETLKDGDDENPRSIVLALTYKDFDAVLTGDATEDTEDGIRERYDDEWLDFEVLKVGHHGSGSSSSKDWLDAIQPQVAIVSCEHYNTFNHPRKNIVKRIAGHTVDLTTPHKMRTGVGSYDDPEYEPQHEFREAIYSTAAQGTIVVRTDGSKYSVIYANTKEDEFAVK